MQDTFNKMVMEHFQYLIEDYHFKIIEISDHVQRDVKVEGFVEYQSSFTFVTITGEWYWNGVAFGWIKDARKFALSSELIHEFVSLTAKERGMVCSPDPKDNRTARNLVNSKRLQHVKREFSSNAEEKDSQLADHARWLRQYADPFLRGDFSRWREIYEYKVARMIGEHKRAGKSEWGLRYAGTDATGKPIHEKQHIFQSSLDYLAASREEAR